MNLMNTAYLCPQVEKLVLAKLVSVLLHLLERNGPRITQVWKCLEC